MKAITARLARILGYNHKRKHAYIDTSIFTNMVWMNKDVVVSAGPKQGTNWMLNIAHQLRTSGDEEFEDIIAECPWIELLDFPNQSHEERLDKFSATKNQYPFRIFKTHEVPPALPLDNRVRYLVPIRNGKDTLVSMYNFSKLAPQFTETWSRKHPRQQSFDKFFYKYVHGWEGKAYWDFINGWWPYRHDDNVFMIHFNDIKREPEVVIRNIADFLKLDIDEPVWDSIIEKCSFEWMKLNSEKFESSMVKGIIRKGIIGDHKHLFSDAHTREWSEMQLKHISDLRQREWADNGGQLP